MPAKLAHNPHPGEILDEEFVQPLKLSYYRLAQATGLATSRLYEIRDGDRGVTADTALRLARALGTAPGFWVNLQSHFDLVEAQQANAGEYKRIMRLVAAPV